APRGLEWDHVNYSCAYDALFTGPYNIWQDHGPKWTNRFASISDRAHALGTGFEAFANKTRSLEAVRDRVRGSLAAEKRGNFPTGAAFTYIDRLTEAMFDDSYWGTDTI
ncbi:hypothetical protein DFH08DRAFT_618591, partial [Mycena albidolilacea]